MHPSRRRYLRYALWGWALVASVGSTIGALSGILDRENDRT